METKIDLDKDSIAKESINNDTVDDSDKPVITSTEEDKFDDIVQNSDIQDITAKTPSKEDLANLMKKIKNMRPQDRKQLLSNIASQNSINPNENEYSTMSKKNMLKMRMKNKLSIMQNSRVSKASLEAKKASYIKKHTKQTVTEDKELTPDLTPIEEHLQELQNVVDESTEESNDSAQAPEETN